jgi:hypothetical protein
VVEAAGVDLAVGLSGGAAPPHARRALGPKSMGGFQILLDAVVGAHFVRPAS